MSAPMVDEGLRTDDLDYELPEHLIATEPAQPRDAARLMVIRRSSAAIEHRHVRDLPEYLRQGDALVFNNTAVAAARLVGRRAGTGGRVEGLFLREEGGGADGIGWRVMLKAGGRLRLGDRIELPDARGRPTAISMELTQVHEAGEWSVTLRGIDSTQRALEMIGRTPLPPYILKARGQREADDRLDRAWYQTVYADLSHQQSVAAPTAGLHFTPDLLAKLDAAGVRRISLRLDVGAGTFKPITAARVDEHRMHAERFEVREGAVRDLREALAAHDRAGATLTGPRIIAVGSTALRTLETIAQTLPKPAEIYGRMSGMTDLLIAPPYEFKVADGLLTNFHLPRTTLLALVAAMIGLGRLKDVYGMAIERGYRFYSYGDAMLILP
ncbi:MAG: tRNA preQ1(34) S-adenosylmethionine ribosyltransferase-isomerase QueA [Phycisphaerales bacterium]|nr:tRNA preQ1(34) S-adenosylmethionine ribosyltransferase-isomerase QueA [Phycisphaerales bacterium]MCI0674442.1 tRNA preQ1(34) S-adenosylmethionine ribosyltransferase-isomerase QueA [Phycisphaerales bacterium]